MHFHFLSSVPWRTLVYSLLVVIIIKEFFTATANKRITSLIEGLPWNRQCSSTSYTNWFSPHTKLVVTFITLILHMRQMNHRHSRKLPNVTLVELGFKTKKFSFKDCAVFLCIRFLIVSFCGFLLLKTKRLLLLDKTDLSYTDFINLPKKRRKTKTNNQLRWIEQLYSGPWTLSCKDVLLS